MNARLSRLTIALAGSCLVAATAVSGAGLFDLTFDDGTDEWRVVLDGVMGGRSSGRVTQSQPGVLQFAGELSLENNGGFSQIRRRVADGAFSDADGVALRVRGDGRTYTFDIRASNVRLMAGGYQRTFDTVAGEWLDVTLPFDEFRVYNFGRRLTDAPALSPDLIESVGVTLADKNPGFFRIELDSIRGYRNGDAVAMRSSDTSGSDLASVASSAGLTTLLDLVAASGIAEDLPEGERLTIFAPTNDAFAALPEATVRFLTSPEGRDALRAILAHHVTTPALPSSELLGRRSVSMLGGQRVGVGEDGAITVGAAGLVAVDVPFDGGIVHVIDSVLIPERQSIAELASHEPQLSTLAAAVGAAGLGDQLGPENGPFTVFAPINSAFKALPSGTVDQLLRSENRDDLVALLGAHVVPGRLYANQLAGSGSASTYFGAPLQFEVLDGELIAGGATIIASDIEAANGVVHLIDRVIRPAPTAPPSAMAGASAARMVEIAVDRGAPLFNDGNVAACAAVYEVAIRAMLEFGEGQLGDTVQRSLEIALAEAATEDDPREQSWIYRRAMDEVYPRLVSISGERRVTDAR